MIRNGLCRVRVFHKCLSNRYGERVEDVPRLEHWKWPRCGGLCNCSMCIKIRCYPLFITGDSVAPRITLQEIGSFHSPSCHDKR
ncbi:unnamed protein product [Victoria cruziana]